MSTGNLDRGNRVVGTVLAVVLIALGVLGLLRSYSVLQDGTDDDPLLLRQLQDFVADTEPWFWVAAFVIALVLAWLGWRWLRAQLLPTSSLGQLTVAQGEEGRTTLVTSAVAAAVERDLEDDPDIASARVRVVGSERSPALDIRATVTDSAVPTEVRARIEQEVVGKARSALERPDLTATVRLKLGDPAPRAIA